MSRTAEREEESVEVVGRWVNLEEKEEGVSEGRGEGEEGEDGRVRGGEGFVHRWSEVLRESLDEEFGARFCGFGRGNDGIRAWTEQEKTRKRDRWI